MFRAWFGANSDNASGALSPPDREADSKENAAGLDTLEAGPAGAQHATHYKMPDVSSELVEKQAFIPSRVAEEKIHDAAAALDSTKKAFEARITVLQAFHEASKEKNEKFFNDHVSELKEKARRHVQVQRDLKTQLEARLNARIQEHTNTIEDLRDSLADMHGEVREKVQEIVKQQISIRSLQTSLDSKVLRLEVGLVLNAQIVPEVELRCVRSELTEALGNVAEQKHAAIEADLHSSEFLAEKVEQLEREHAAALARVRQEALEGAGVQLARLQTELATMKTKYIGLKLQSSAALSKAERQRMQLQSDLVQLEVQICVADMLSQLAPEVLEVPLSAPAHVSSSQDVPKLKSQKSIVSAPVHLSSSQEVPKLKSQKSIVQSQTKATPKRGDARNKQFELHIDAATHGDETVQALCARTQAEADGLQKQYEITVSALAAQRKAVRSAQNALDAWGLAFEKEQGRTSTDEDRAASSGAAQLLSARNVAQAQYRQIEDAKSSLLELKIEAEARMSLLRDQASQLDLDISSAALSPSVTTTAAILTEAGDTKDAAAAAVDVNALLEMQGFALEHQQRSKQMEAMEDALLQLKEELVRSAARSKAAEEDKLVIQEQLAAIVKEKRSDVMARLADEVDKSRADYLELTEVVAKLTKDNVKSTEKIKELNGLLDMATEELKVHDDRYQNGAAAEGDPEKTQLRGIIEKQRKDVAAKAKAATAGWNAAATADEEKDIAVQKAYDRGFSEAKEKLRADNAAITGALEKKDSRITELMLEVQEAEGRVRIAQKATEDAQAQTREAQLEVADTIASIAVSGVGDSGTDTVPSADFERVRASLDAAQEEIVELTEKVQLLESDARVAAQTISVYEQLRSAAAKVSSGAPITPAVQAVSSAGRSVKAPATAALPSGKNNLPDVLAAVKAAVIEGTNLWKAGKRDECCFLYRSSCENALQLLRSSALLDPLRSSMQLTADQDPAKAAVTYRKALDKLLADGKDPVFKRAEDAATSGEVVTQPQEEVKVRVVKRSGTLRPGADDAVARELEQQLISLKQQLSQSERDKQEALNEARSAASESASSLLSRAKTAEKQVELLKKQLAQLANSMQNAQSAPAPGKAGSNSDAETTLAAVEARRLQRRIKLLEEQLKAGGDGTGAAGAAAGGVGGGAESKRAQIQAEKAAAKKYKELDAASKKQIAALERRATTAEKALEKMSVDAQPAIEERDSLRIKVRELTKASADLETLRTQVQEIPRLRDEAERLSSELSVTAESLKKESLLRKKYKNEIEDMKGAIRVYARARPMAQYEKERGCTVVTQMTSDETLTVQSDRGLKDFTFDQVFDSDSKQESVFEDTRLLMESCLDGYNVCLFAYGQTGSGKTFTMTGSPDMPGLTPRAIDEIYRLITERAAMRITVKTYFVEIYLDTIVDLYYILDNKGAKKGGGAASEPPKLDIKLDNKKMVYISNCTVKDAGSAGELMTLFTRGNAERHVGATKMNAESSRSHSIFAILIESFDPRTQRTVTGKLSLVDLAGSERADKTGATADRLKEGIAINKSLSALGDVISALSTGEKIIPYRNSKLTQMMQDSLGGNAKTLMFVNFSPADYNADETVSSLNYATRVKKITNDASKAAESQEVTNLKTIIKKLKAGQAVADDEIGGI